MRSASECVRRSQCAARHTERTCRADSIHTATPDGPVWCELGYCSESERVMSESSSHRRSGRDTDKTVLSCLQWRINANRGPWQLFARGPLLTRDKDLSKLYPCERVGTGQWHEWHSQPLESTRHAGNYFVPLSIQPIFIFL